MSRMQTVGGNSNIRLRVVDLLKVRGDSKREVRVEIPELSVGPGEFVAVVGANGSGKSTLLDMLGLILAPDLVSEFVLDGDPPLDLGSLSPGERIRVRRDSFTYALQNGGLLEFLSIRENIRFSAQLKGKPPTKIEEVARILDLGDVLDKRPGKCSGGQRQKAAIACALVQEPQIILADEPTAALDPPSAKKLIETFRCLTRDAGAGLIMVTHAHELVQDCADAIYRFHIEEESNSVLRSILVRDYLPDRVTDRGLLCSSATSDTLPL